MFVRAARDDQMKYWIGGKKTDCAPVLNLLSAHISMMLYPQNLDFLIEHNLYNSVLSLLYSLKKACLVIYVFFCTSSTSSISYSLFFSQEAITSPVSEFIKLYIYIKI